MDMGSSTRFCRHSLTSDTGREVWIYHANVKGDESYEYMIHHDTLQLTFPSSWSCVYSRTEIYRNQVSVQKCSKYQKCFDNLIDIEVSSRKYLEVSSHHRPIILYRSPTHFQPDIHLLKMERPVDFPGLNPSHPIRTIRNGFFFGRAPFWGKSDKHRRWPRKRHIRRRDNALCIRSTLSHLSASCRADRHHLFFVDGKNCECRLHLQIQMLISARCSEMVKGC